MEEAYGMPETAVRSPHGKRSAAKPESGIPVRSAVWEAVFAAAPVPLLLVDADGTVERANAACNAFWQADPDELKPGTDLRVFLRSSTVACDEEELVRCEPFLLGASSELRLRCGSMRIVDITSNSLGKGRRVLSFADGKAQSELFRAALDCFPEPVYVKDAGLRYVVVNGAYAKRWGTTPEAMIGRRSADFALNDSASRFEASERHVLETGETFEASEEGRPDEDTPFLLVRKCRLSVRGRAYVAGAVLDVSENRRREQEAEQARRQLVDVLEFMPAGIIIYDRDNRLVLANRVIKDLLPGIDRIWTPGTPLRDALLEGRRKGYFQRSGDPEIDSLYGGDPEKWVDRYIRLYDRDHAVWEREHQDGRWFQIFDTRTADGMFVGVRLDITALKQREAQLRQTLRENELFQTLIDNVPVSIYAKRPDLRLTYVNQGWCDLTGKSREEAIGRTDVELFGREGETFREGDLEVLRSGRATMIEERAVKAGGRVGHQIARKGVMTASDGSVYLIGSTTEITELKEREEELREARLRAELADRVKGEFLANMSHEIRTPMNGVLGMAELLASSELDNRQRAFVDIIVKSGNALLTIINDILDFSKIDAGQMTLDAATFDLVEAIEDVTTLLSTRAKEKDLELILRVDPAIGRRFVGDAGRFRQIATNLVGNALKFTEAGHVLIDVSGERVPGEAQTRLEVCVRDTGIGIPASQLSHIFEKFAQVDASSTRRHEGTGLGLAISARLAALMGGTIQARSTEGEGSAFTFSVTLAEAAEDAVPASSAAALTGVRILIVDDNAMNRQILLEQARSWGADACAAANGVEALAVLAAAAALHAPVDCVVLDHLMPGMSGLDLATRIRGVPPIARTPLVLLSSVDQVVAPASLDRLDLAAQLIKPARSAVLRETVASAIGAQATQRRPAPAPQIFADASGGGQGAPSDRPLASHRVDILIAEDNEVNQLVFSQILAGTPYSFQIVGNGRLACQAFRDMSPRMILMDVAMPEMNGLEACAAIRATEEGSHVPVIGVTAHALKGDRERCLDVGMDDYLPKPISPRTLMEKVERWIAAADDRSCHPASSPESRR